jgi:3-methyladenine DNA glycosylase/8-oxoguanine DNA glycosylase
MVALRDFIANRRKEIRLQIERLQAELVELDSAESALGHDLFSDFPPANPAPEHLTFKGMAIEILRQNPSGLPAAELRRQMEARFGQIIMRSSLSPQLSRLAYEGILRREGKVWKRTGATDKEARYVPSP